MNNNLQLTRGDESVRIEMIRVKNELKLAQLDLRPFLKTCDSIHRELKDKINEVYLLPDPLPGKIWNSVVTGDKCDNPWPDELLKKFSDTLTQMKDLFLGLCDYNSQQPFATSSSDPRPNVPEIAQISEM